MLFTQRLPRILLWLLLIFLPTLYCVSFVVSDFVSIFLYFSSPEMADGPVSNSLNPWSYYLRLLILAVLWLHPLWIAFISCASLLLLAAFVVRITKRKPFTKDPSSVMQLASNLLILLFLAYTMGSLIHFASSPWLSEFPQQPIPSNYWWPYYGWPVQDSVVQGWTIYPPLGMDLPMSPWAKAACFKLGALLALLAARYIWLRRNRTLLQLSANS